MTSNEYAKARKEVCLRLGRCVVCGRNPHTENSQLCTECAARASAWHAARKARRAEAGLCLRCGKPVDSEYKHCTACLERERQLKAASKTRNEVEHAEGH